MIEEFFNRFSKQNQGNILIGSGLLLLLHALDIIRGLSLMIVLAACAIIWYGVVRAGYDVRLQEWIQKTDRPE